MIVSRQELAGAFAALVVLCTVAGAAKAQGGSAASAPPQSLSNQQPDAPAASEPPAPAQMPAIPIVAVGGVPPPPKVLVSTLGGVDGPPVGLLDDATGGLGAQMWSGSDRGMLEDALTRIPVVTTDPAVRGLARRLLLTSSEAPTGPGQW